MSRRPKKDPKPTPSVRDQILADFATLRVPVNADQLDEALKKAQDAGCSHLDFLHHLLADQAGLRRQRRIERLINAAKFREAAARALLLPRRRPGGRTPLWQQRKRAADLLAVAARFGSFPMLLEAYRECLRDIFDIPALVNTLQRIQSRALHLVTVDSATPSPFAASLLFGYVANYIYDGDAPLAERRAQALAIDQSQLRDLLGRSSTKIRPRF